MVARPRGQFHVAQFPRLAPDRGFIERNCEFVVKPSNQIDHTPANDTMDSRDWAALDNLDQRLSLGVTEPGRLARRLAIKQSIWTAVGEPNGPVPHDL